LITRTVIAVRATATFLKCKYNCDTSMV